MDPRPPDPVPPPGPTKIEYSSNRTVAADRLRSKVLSDSRAQAFIIAFSASFFLLPFLLVFPLNLPTHVGVSLVLVFSPFTISLGVVAALATYILIGAIHGTDVIHRINNPQPSFPPSQPPLSTPPTPPETLPSPGRPSPHGRSSSTPDSNLPPADAPAPSAPSVPTTPPPP